MSFLTQAGKIGGSTALTGAALSLGTGLMIPSAAAASSTLIGGLMTNPWTIGIGAGIAGAALWVNSQGHRKANDWIQKYQNPWDKSAGDFMNKLWADRKAGTLTYDDAIARQNEFESNVADLEDRQSEFSAKGKDQATVITQGKARQAPIFAGWRSSIQEQIDALKPPDPTAGIDETKPPTLDKNAPLKAQGAAEQQRRRALSMQGRASTILTGNREQSGFGAARPTLLGY